MRRRSLDQPNEPTSQELMPSKPLAAPATVPPVRSTSAAAAATCTPKRLRIDSTYFFRHSATAGTFTFAVDAAAASASSAVGGGDTLAALKASPMQLASSMLKRGSKLSQNTTRKPSEKATTS